MTDARPTEPRATSSAPTTAAPGRQARRPSSSSAAPAAAARTSLARLLARHARSCMIPVEVPLPRRGAGLPGPARGSVSKRDVRAAPARVLVEGLSDRPDARHVPVRARGSASSGARRCLRGGLRRRPRGGLPAALLRPAVVRARRTEARGRAALVEQSCDTIAAGADPGAAVPGGEVRPRGPRRPRRLGLARRPDAGADPPAHAPPGARVVGGADPARSTPGAQAIPPDRLLDRSASTSCCCSAARRDLRAALPLRRRLRSSGRMRSFFQREMSAERRQRRALARRASRAPARERARARATARSLDRLEADGVGCAPLLRRTLERSRTGAARS